jgi:hypothetical protein
MDLLFGKLALLDYEGTELRHRHPSADAFALLAVQLAGVDSVARIEVPAQPSLFLFEVRRHGRGPLLVVWVQRDPFSGEDEPPIPFDWPWSPPAALVVDALGQAQPARLGDGRVHLQVSLTPLFVAADGGGPPPDPLVRSDSRGARPTGRPRGPGGAARRARSSGRARPG